MIKLKKKSMAAWTFSILCIIAILICAVQIYHYFSTPFDYYAEYEPYCARLNEFLKEESFDVAVVEPGKIVLKNSERKVIKTIPFSDYDSSCSIWGGITKNEENDIFIPLGGAVDDVSGLVFVNKPEHDINTVREDGIQQLKLVGENCYYYSTWAE